MGESIKSAARFPRCFLLPEMRNARLISYGATQMNQLEIILPILYFCISLWCFLLAMKGLKTRKLIFKRGVKGTGLENSTSLMWAQIIATFILGLGLLIYALMYASIVLPKFLLAG
jgi:hypothetical protein